MLKMTAEDKRQYPQVAALVEKLERAGADEAQVEAVLELVVLVGDYYSGDLCPGDLGTGLGN